MGPGGPGRVTGWAPLICCGPRGSWDGNTSRGVQGCLSEEALVLDIYQTVLSQGGYYRRLLISTTDDFGGKFRSWEFQFPPLRALSGFCELRPGRLLPWSSGPRSRPVETPEWVPRCRPIPPGPPGPQCPEKNGLSKTWDDSLVAATDPRFPCQKNQGNAGPGGERSTRFLLHPRRDFMFLNNISKWCELW